MHCCMCAMPAHIHNRAHCTCFALSSPFHSHCILPYSALSALASPLQAGNPGEEGALARCMLQPSTFCITLVLGVAACMHENCLPITQRSLCCHCISQTPHSVLCSAVQTWRTAKAVVSVCARVCVRVFLSVLCAIASGGLCEGSSTASGLHTVCF